MPLSKDLRERIVKASENGLTQMVISEHLMVAQSSVSRILNRAKHNQLEPGKPPGRPRKFSKEDDAFIAEKVKQKQDITCKELVLAVQEELGKKVSSQTINCSLKRLNLTRKKRLFMTPKETHTKLNKDERNSKNWPVK